MTNPANAAATIPGLTDASGSITALFNQNATNNPLLQLLGVSPSSSVGRSLGGRAGTININPTAPPPMKTLVYSPDIRILIAHDSVQYDVSRDIVGWSIRRAENSVASLVFRLANKAVSGTDNRLRYNQLFERMDRIIVMAKRVEWVQVYSGYLDSVPLVQLYPGTVNMRASCTMKRLIHTWWDPGLPSSQHIFDQAGAEHDTPTGVKQADSGIGTMLRRLLVEVGGWSDNNIHIQKFPNGYYYFMQQQLQNLAKTDADVKAFERLLLGSDTTLGTGYVAGAQPGVTTAAYTAPGDIPSRKLQVLQAVDAMGMGVANTDLGLGQGIGSAATGGKDNKDQAAWQANTQLGKNYAQAAMQNDAAVHCFMVIYDESHWTMYANNSDPDSLTFPHEAISTDHDSEGLFQQRMTWGTTGQRMNTFASTQMFLQELQKQDWRNMPRPQACQAVQRSGDSSGSNYAAFEQTALAEVQALRQGVSGQGQSSQGNVAGLGAPVSSGAALTSVTGAVLNGSAGIPTTGGVPNPAGAASVVGRPAVDTGGAISYATSKLGCPYVWGTTGPATFDCSGLTQAAYASIGVAIGRNTTQQKGTGVQVTPQTAVPGDLIFPVEYDHVVMYLGGNTIIEAPTEGQNVSTRAIYFNPAAAMWRHYPPAEYGGSPVAPFNPNPTTPGSAPGTIAQGAAGGTVATQSNEPIARNLFTYQFAAGQFASAVSSYFGDQPGTEEKAFINDEPLIQTVQSMCAAGLRNFSSAPNGDFVAYYPDYFGLDGKNAVLNLEDIECKNVQIDLNDDALATHVYVAGSPNPRGASMGVLGWLMSKGVATVENEWLFRRMQLAAPMVPGQTITSGQEMMRKFGVRPLTRDMSAIQSGPMEFLMALQLFMTKWAEQYATTIDLTFMPELFPGMRLNLVGHNLQVYVTEVTHAGDFESGFTTSAVIMAPSNTTLSKIVSQLSGMTMPTSGTGSTSGSASSADTGLSDALNTATQWFYGGGS
jgi:cell wall-associated NlpC family hydrolase